MHVGTSKVTSKGQVTIPADIRADLGLETGTEIIFIESDDAIVIRKAEDVLAMFGKVERKVRSLGITRGDVDKMVKKERKRIWKKEYA